MMLDLLSAHFGSHAPWRISPAHARVWHPGQAWLLSGLFLVACSGPVEPSPTPPETPPTDAPTQDVSPSPTMGLESPTPGTSGLVLNEVSCDPEDWVELLALGPGAVSLDGVSVSDYPTDPEHTFTFPSGEQLNPGERRVVDSSQLPFGLSCGADTLTLLDASNRVLDRVEVPELHTEITWGRLPDGTGDWAETLPTSGAVNAAPPTDPSAVLFDPFSIFQVDLRLPPPSVAALYVDPYTYVDAEVVVRVDQKVYGPLVVGVRLKGVYGSFQSLDGKAAFKVKFNYEDPNARFFGKKTLTLNNMLQDPSMHHEHLAYGAFRAVGVEAARTGNAWITVNGEDYGLYVHVETYDDVLLDERFESTQHLYEGAYGSDVTPGSEYAFEVDEGDEDDRSDLTDLINRVNYVEDDLWIKGMADVSDLPELLRMWAAELYLGHWDGYVTRNNYYLHSTEQGIFRMLPWGTDQTFDAHLSLTGTQGVMFTRCVAIPECRGLYLKTLEDLVVTMESLALESESLALAEFLQPYVDVDPRKPYTSADVAAWQASTRAFIVSRGAEVREWLACEQYGDCPPCPTLELGSHAYFYCDGSTTWEEARTTCQHQGTDLVVLETVEESLAVEGALVDQYGISDFWIGLSDLEVEGDWRWVSGQTPGFTAWASGEPNDSGGEDCAQQLAGGMWNDLPCTATLAAVCEAPCELGTDADGDGIDACLGDCDDSNPDLYPGAEDLCSDGLDQDCSGEVDDGPGCTDCVLAEIGLTGYLFCPDLRTFDEARVNCLTLGADLASFSSLDDQLAVWEGFVQVLGNRDAYFGLTDIEEEGVWRWVDGTELTYSYWAPGQPDNAGEEDYGGFFWDGSWNDWPSYYALASICELPPPVLTGE